MKLLQRLLWLAIIAPVAMAQPVLIDPPDFSDSFPNGAPDPSATHPGTGCFWLASGEIIPGDVDWIQILIPFDTNEVIVDVDITSGSGSSHLFVSSSNGVSGSNNDDGNSAFDQNCGGAGLASDSVVRLGTTPAGAVFGIGISGGMDAGFIGSHNETFSYDVRVRALGTLPGCIQDSDCDDGVGCTVDVCDLTTGACNVTPDDMACDDGVSCTQEVCDVDNDCLFVTNDSLCDDGVGCTLDTCDAVNDCQHTLDDSLCDDAIGCTMDTCDPINDCQHQADDMICDNGLFCDGEEFCDVVNDCQDGPDPCFPGDICDEANGCQPTVSIPVEIDINPRRCPNRLIRARRGFFSVALTGTSQLSVSDVDTSSLMLSRADGVGQSVAPFMGSFGPPIMERDAIGFEDAQACVCRATRADGILDLVIPFKVVETFNAFSIDSNEFIWNLELVLTGRTNSGDRFAASDCVLIIPIANKRPVRSR